MTTLALSVRRGGRTSVWTGVGSGVVVLLLAYLPYLVTTSVTGTVVTFFELLAMSVMWNLLAGYAGLVSIGQQAYVGLGAYAVLQLSDWGVQPYLGVFLAAGVCAVIALPTSLLAFRLRGDYFAVGTWVIAEVYHLLLSRDSALGGGSGRALTTLSGLDPLVRQAITYWVALAVCVLCVLGCYLLLRSRLGLALTAVRDNEVAAGSTGVAVGRAKRLVYLVASAGAGAAGGLILVSQLNVAPDSIFSVQYTAYMIFIVVVGGIGTLEGPILGAVIFVVIQQLFADAGVWYLILLGVLAIGVAIWLPRGLWGAISQWSGVRLFSVGYSVRGLDRKDGT
ncbi:MAG TPA: branched-chain amino acid ABC transporter permease [Pseudonocardiaceae bacterium]|nr:branched-chain amino acid ABC transporter permease [Pseudonocardiaceae bacterium]